MESKIFRKTALDKISSPEQLNEYMKVAGPGVWIMLGGLAAVFIAFFIWGVMGSIPETAELTGTALSPEGEPMAIYCYLSVGEGKVISEGMDVRAPSGYIAGTVISVGHIPADNTLEVVIGLDNYDDIIVGSPVSLTVVTAERKPYELLFR